MIDAEKLKARIDELGDVLNDPICQRDALGPDWVCGGKVMLKKIRSSIETLQQEQPDLPGIEDPGIPGKDYIPVEWVDACEMYGKWKIVKQEQPEVGLDKFTEKIKTFQTRYKHPEIVSIKGAMAFMARMFYLYPNVARQWYEQLPKVTMD